jgi:hypothetical protein
LKGCFSLEEFERIEHNGTVNGAVSHVPHAAYHRSSPFHKVRKELAGLRACFVDGAQIPVEEDASILVPLQDAAFFRCFDRVVTDKFVEFQPKEATKMVNVAVRHLRCGNPAAIGACSAIDLIFHFLRDRFEAPFYKIVPPQPGAEPPILLAVFLPVALDLYEVC